MLEERVRRAAEAAGLGPGAGQHVGHAAAGAALELQVVVVARHVQLHAVPLQQRLHVLCGRVIGRASWKHEGLVKEGMILL